MTDANRSGVRPARVLFLDHASIIGGAELVLATHIAALDRARFHPLVACTDAVPALVDLYRASGADVHILPMPRLRRLSLSVPAALVAAAARMRRLVLAQRVDLVVANTSRAAYVAATALPGTHVPLVCWVRDFLFGRTAFRILSARAASVICVSEAVRDYYGGRADPRFAVIHVGSSLDDDLSMVSPDDVRSERERWGFADTDVVVGFMGRLVAEKGPEDVVDAVVMAHEADARIKLLVVGSGHGQSGNVEDALRAQMRQQALDCVILAGFQRDQATYYRMFDIFVLATRTPEPYATSVVQAMMANTPVIATCTGGTPELVRNGVTGLLVPPNSPGAIAAGILRLVRDPALRRRLVDQAREEVLTHNRESVITPLAEAIYARALGEATR